MECLIIASAKKKKNPKMINLDKHLGDFGPGNFGHASGSYMREIITYARHNKHLQLNLLRLMITLA